MSFNVEGKECQYCHAKLFKEDDVAVCPVCGAPHHRDCYKSLGHCALEEFHGTENSYDKRPEVKESGEDVKKEFTPPDPRIENESVVKCQMCGEIYNKDSVACPKCGAPNLAKVGGNRVVIDFLGGVSPDVDLGEGVTADEAKRFVMANTAKYIPKFEKIKKGRKAFFNVLAFLFPCPWLFSRKMYKLGIIAGVTEGALMALLFPFYSEIMDFIPSSDTLFSSTSDYLNAIPKEFPERILLFMLLYFAVFLIVSAIHVLFGIFGDLVYRNHVISTVKEIKEYDLDPDEYDEVIQKKGGISLLMLVVGFLLTRYLPLIIATLAGVQGIY